jgi:hypothetical protein
VITHLRLYYTVSVCAATLAIAGGTWLARRRRKRPDPEQLRRNWLSRAGRVTIGTTLDFQEAQDNREQPVQLLIYRYDVAGVAYEASQDITHLGQFIDMQSFRLGLPASIKYDPHNPGNSIVISETWSGLRK